MRTHLSRPYRSSLARRAVIAAATPVLLVACSSSDGSDSIAPTTQAVVDEDVAETEEVVTEDTPDDTETADTVVEPPETEADTETETDAEAETETGTEVVTEPTDGLDVSLFFDGALVTEPDVVDCTLSGGTETTCYEITVSGFPSSYDVGPFCPTTIDDEEGGLWWDGEAIYDLNGEFIQNLSVIYSDDNWQMFDADGNVFVTETAEEFELAARPDVDESLQNHCVQGMLEWLTNGEPVTSTVMIPTTPVAADASAAPQGNQGITLDGVVIAASAPVEAILGAYTIAAFDDCGAHYNPVDGYHMHGAVGCSEIETTEDDDPAMFGYALDGYPIHSPFEDEATAAEAGLDECNGHIGEDGTYHYHANSAEQNQVVECLIGQTVANTDAAGGGGGGGGGDRPDGPPPGDG